MRLLRLCLFFCWSGQALAGLPPQQVSITYSLSKGRIPLAQVEETLRHDGKTYTLAAEGRATGVLALLNKGAIRRESRGLVTAQGLRPQFFEDRRSERPAVSARFDWDRKLLTLEEQGKQETLALPQPAHDRLSFPYSFAFSPAPGKELIFSMTDGRHLSNYRYFLAGKETLTTALGALETLHFVKQREDENDSGAELWLSLQHHLLPLRILVIEKDGGVLDQTAVRIVYP